MRKRYQRGRKARQTAAVQSAAVCLAFVFLFFLFSRIDAAAFLLNLTLPGFSPLSGENKTMYKFSGGLNDLPGDRPAIKNEGDSSLIFVSELIGVDDVDLQPETESETMPSEELEPVVFEDIENLHDFEYVKKNFFTVDKGTGLSEGYFDVDDMLAADLSLNLSEPGPKVIIFHTHSSEMYADSDSGSLMDGVFGVGARLAETLNSKYGIETLHHTGRYDTVNGYAHRPGAYERMAPEIERILSENPSIEVAIDIHRDGVRADTRLVTDFNGIPTAQIMFVNGLCLQNISGNLVPYGLQNPYIQTNLALSFNAQLTANSLYPGFARKIYLNAYRYSLNMLPKSLLIEVGAQTNTKEEALNAIGPLAVILSQVLLK